MTYLAVVAAYVLIVLCCRKRIFEHGQPYIDRWYLFRSPWRRVFLHHIHKRDDNPHLHNHPWDCWTFVLWGWYREMRQRGPGRAVYLRRVAAGDTNDLGPDVWHRITDVSPGGAWTLVFAGRRVRTWGFLLPNGRFVPGAEERARVK